MEEIHCNKSVFCCAQKLHIKNKKSFNEVLTKYIRFYYGKYNLLSDEWLNSEKNKILDIFEKAYNLEQQKQNITKIFEEYIRYIDEEEKNDAYNELISLYNVWKKCIKETSNKLTNTLINN